MSLFITLSIVITLVVGVALSYSTNKAMKIEDNDNY